MYSAGCFYSKSKQLNKEEEIPYYLTKIIEIMSDLYYY